MNAGADILHPQSWNAYGYVLGNPLALVDPSGMFLETPPPNLDPDPIDSGWFCLSCRIFAPVNTPSGGGGGAGGKTPSAPPKINNLQSAKSGTQKSCPSVPAWPPNKLSVNANMQQSLQPQPVPGMGLAYAASATIVRLTSWFNNVCCWASAWNFQGGDNGNANLPQFDDAGNFNFGATGVAAGVPSSALMWSGGLVKNINYWSKGKPNPYRNQPYMNDPHKMAMIAQGIQYAQNGCP